MNIKRLVSLVCCVVLLGSLVGCGMISDDVDASPPSSPTAGTSPGADASPGADVPSAAVAALYHQYIQDQLMPEYGLATLAASGTMENPEDRWLSLSGVMSAYIADLNLDGTDDLLLFCYKEVESPYSDDLPLYALYAELYMMKGGTPAKVDELEVCAYNESDELDRYDHWASLTPNHWFEENLFISCVMADDVPTIVVEFTSVGGIFSDGYLCDYWALTCADEDLEIAFSFTQTAGGSAGFEYTGYELANGDKVFQELLFTELPEDGGLYHDFGEALEVFFDGFGIDVRYQGSAVSILDDTAVVQRIHTYATKCTDADWDSSIYPFAFEATDGTDLRAYCE